MKPLNDIQYVELERAEVADRAMSFFLRRFTQETFRPSSSDVPHRHTYQEIFIVEAGHGQHVIDGQPIDLLPGSVSLIGKGQVHVVEHLTDFSGWVIRFNDEFLPAGLISRTWNYHATLFNQLGPTQTLTITPADLHDLQRVLELLEAEYTRPDAFQQENVLRHILSIVLIQLERVYQNSFGTNHHEREAYRVYQQFMTLLHDNFMQHHDVEFYATALRLVPVKLSKILNRIVGKPTKHLIDERIVLEAKRYLHYTDLSIKEIAYVLGYSDLFHFSKTFKRLTGASPQAFREQQKMT